MDIRLAENTAFLCYYEKWQRNPTSVVFAAISEMFREHGMIDDAIRIAKEGLKHHPNLVSGRLALARAFMAKQEPLLARDQALFILSLVPNHEEAKKLLSSQPTLSASFEAEKEEITEDMPLSDIPQEKATESVVDHKSWHTATMAKIFASQGHIDKARHIYQEILKSQPNNEDVRRELLNL